jgi:hypothetical protein
VSNHRPRTDPGPPIPTIVSSALLTLTIAVTSAWIILGDGPTDARHIVGFLLGNCLAVVTFAQTVIWASERATAQARIRRFKDLEECQDQQRKLQSSWVRSEKSFVGPHATGVARPAANPWARPVTGYTGGDRTEPWVTAQTEVLRTDGRAAETQVLITGDAVLVTGDAATGTETQVLATGGAAETQVMVTGEAAETQVLATLMPTVDEH